LLYYAQQDAKPENKEEKVLNCKFCEAMAGSLSMATIAVSSAKGAVVDPGEGGRSAALS
jgi:hypothetical protein